MCGKVAGDMRGRGACMAGGVHGRRGMHGTGTHMAGGHEWQERWPLQQMVCILLECILVKINAIAMELTHA